MIPDDNCIQLPPTVLYSKEKPFEHPLSVHERRAELSLILVVVRLVGCCPKQDL